MTDNKKKVTLGSIARWRREVSWVKEMVSIKRGEGRGNAREIEKKHRRNKKTKNKKLKKEKRRDRYCARESNKQIFFCL